MLSNDFLFKRAIYILLAELKEHITETQFEELFVRLNQNFEKIPGNDLDESRPFLMDVAKFIFQDLHAFYDIETTEGKSGGRNYLQQMIFTPLPEYKNLEELFSKYKSMKRFSSTFLRNHNRDLYTVLQRGTNANPMKQKATVRSDGSYAYTISRFPISHPIALPYDGTDSFGSPAGLEGSFNYFVRMDQVVRQQKQYFLRLVEEHASLTRAVNVFEQQLAGAVTAAYAELNLQLIRELLVHSIVPVSLITDDTVRDTLLKADAHIVFKPVDFLKVGSSFHIYASDMEDDSTFIAKPVLSTPATSIELPGLHYLGVGQYTGFDPLSPRSLEGKLPHVINGQIYVAIEIEDSLSLYPEIMHASIQDSNELLQRLELTHQQLNYEPSSQLLEITQGLNTRREDNLFDTFHNFIRLYGTIDTSDDVLKGLIESNQLPPQFFTSTAYINPELFSRRPPKFLPNALFFMPHNKHYIAARLNSSSQIEIFTTLDPDAACRSLKLPHGTHVVFNWDRRTMPKARAISSFHTFNS